MASFTAAVIKQILCIFTIFMAPVLVALIHGEAQIIHHIRSQDYMLAFWSIARLSLPRLLSILGMTLLISSIAYCQLPVSMIPSSVPIIGGSDRSMMKLVGVLGAILGVVAWGSFSVQ